MDRVFTDLNVTEPIDETVPEDYDPGYQPTADEIDESVARWEAENKGTGNA